MKKEETDLLKRCGTENPFTVPEGYFECFTEQLIEKLPEREAQRREGLFMPPLPRLRSVRPPGLRPSGSPCCSGSPPTP